MLQALVHNFWKSGQKWHLGGWPGLIQQELLGAKEAGFSGWGREEGQGGRREGRRGREGGGKGGGTGKEDEGGAGRMDGREGGGAARMKGSEGGGKGGRRGREDGGKGGRRGREGGTGRRRRDREKEGQGGEEGREEGQGSRGREKSHGRPQSTSTHQGSPQKPKMTYQRPKGLRQQLWRLLGLKRKEALRRQSHT